MATNVGEELKTKTRTASSGASPMKSTTGNIVKNEANFLNACAKAQG